MHEPEEELGGPTWQPTPIERLAELARTRLHLVAQIDHTDTLLTLAACVLIVGAVISVISEQNRFGFFGQSEWSNAFLFGGQSLARQFRLLVPALAAFAIRSCQRQSLRVRMVLRVATVASAGSTAFYVAGSFRRSPRQSKTTSGEWRDIPSDGVAWTQLSVSIAAALLALVALQPRGLDGSADGQEGVAVEGAAGEFGGAADTTEE